MIFRTTFRWMLLMQSLVIAGAAHAATPVDDPPPVAQQPGDRDGDGLDDLVELQLGTDPGDVDTDGDRLGDGREVELGTDPRSADSDGDGYPDGVEVIDFAFDPAVARYEFNPLIADMPRVRLELQTTPEVLLDVEYENSRSSTLGVESETVRSTEQISSRNTEQSLAVETTLSASATVEASASLTGPSASASVTAGVSTTSANSSTVGWSQSASNSRSEKAARFQQLSTTEGVSFGEGRVRIGVSLRNSGHLAWMIEDLVLSAYTLDPITRRAVATVAGLTIDTGQSFPRTALSAGGDTGTVVFAARGVDVDTIQRLLADPYALNVQPVQLTLLQRDGSPFAFSQDAVRQRCARVMVDFGPQLDLAPERRRPIEEYQVSVTSQGRGGLSFAHVLRQTLGFDLETGTRPWLPAGSDEPRTSRPGLVSLDGVEMTPDLGYWVLIHQANARVGSRTHVYNLLTDAYDLEDLVLAKGESLELYYVRDTDRDLVGDRSEIALGTDWRDPDSDDDGLLDGTEVHGWNHEALGTLTSDPLRQDTDGDLRGDREEREQGTDPRHIDVDNVVPTVTTFEVASVAPRRHDVYKIMVNLRVDDPDALDARVRVTLRAAGGETKEWMLDVGQDHLLEVRTEQGRSPKDPLEVALTVTDHLATLSELLARSDPQRFAELQRLGALEHTVTRRLTCMPQH